MTRNDDDDVIDLADLRDFLTRVLVPVARGVLTEDEFQDAWVSAEHQGSGTVAVCRVLAGDEVWAQVIWRPGQEVDTYRGLAAVIADSLQDFVAESQFGWGQMRTARYTVPPRAGSPRP